MSARKIYFLSFTAVLALMLFSLYLQYFDNIDPCALCTLQRLCFVAIGFFSLIGITVCHIRALEYLIRTLCILFSAIGMALAIRQVWIQHYPGTGGNECAVSLQYMLQVLPLHEVMQKILVGSAECSVRNWEFLSLGMAAWAIVWFALFFLLFTVVLSKRK